MQDNTAKWGVRKLTKFKENSGIPVGFEYFSTNPNIPAGSIPLFGGEYSREVYSDLWSWVQEQAGYLIEESEWQSKSRRNEGNVPFYSKGNGTTTFRVPSLKCWVKGANGIEEVGSYLSAGLPNITGYFYALSFSTASDLKRGAFLSNATPNTGANLASGNQTSNQRKDFNASWESPIYGNSDTVQPKSIVGMWLVKAYGTVTNVGSTDVSNIAQGLTELENRVTPIADGGTGATNAEQARTNLGIKDIATYDVLPIANGGTGATTAAAARANLGIEEIISSSQKKQYSTGWFSATTNTAYSFNTGLTSDKWYIKSFKAKLDNYEFDMRTNQYGDTNQFNGAHCNFNNSTLIVTTDASTLIHAVYLYNKRTGKNTVVNDITSAQLLVVCEEI